MPRAGRVSWIGARDGFGACLGYLAVALWWLWPLPLRLASHAYLDPAGPMHVLRTQDYYLLLWILSWGAHALGTAPLHVFEANAFHPAPLSLAYSEHLLGLQPFFAPVYWPTGNAVLAANVLIILLKVGSAIGVYALARRWMGGVPAWVAGLCFSFAPFERAGLVHFHLFGALWLPFGLLFLDRWLATARRRDLAALGASTVLGVAGSMYLAYAFAFAIGPVALAALWRWRATLDRRRVSGLLLVALAGATTLAALGWPYLRLRALGLVADYGAPDAAPASVLLAGPMVRRYLGAEGFGVFPWALAAIGLCLGGQARRWPRLIGMLLAVVGGVVSMGRAVRVWGIMVPLPYDALVALVPGFSAVRGVSRLAVIAKLGLVLLGACGAEWALRGPRAARLATTAALLAAALATVAPRGPLPLRRVPGCADLHPAYAWLAEQGAGRPLLELPRAAFAAAAQRMYASTCHWLPIVGGASAYPPMVHELIYAIARDLPSDAALQRLVDHVDLGWILAWRRPDRGEELRRFAGPLPPGLDVAARWPDAVLLRVTRQPGPENRRARLLSPSVTLGGASLRPLGPSCPGRLEPGGVRFSRERDEIYVTVRVRNDGQRALPGDGFIPRGLVHVRACTTTTPPRCLPPRRLGADVPPGGAALVTVRIPWRPPFVGFRVPVTIVVDLLQGGIGPLVDCGFAPLDVVIDPRRAPRSAGPAREPGRAGGGAFYGEAALAARRARTSS